MKKLIVVFVITCIGFFCVHAEADNLATLKKKFGERIGEPDTATSSISDSAKVHFLNLAQDKVARLGGLLPLRTDVTFDPDSQRYELPAGLRRIRYVLVWNETQWFNVIDNQGFMHDTNSYQYFQDWKTTEAPEIYLKGNLFFEGQTVRVFYSGVPTAMTKDTSTCQVQSDMQGFVIDEAISYWLFSRLDMAAWQAMWQSVRADMGYAVGAGKK